MNTYLKQMFAGEFDGNAYCDFSSTAAAATAGKDWLLAIFDATGENIYAIGGQKTLTINRSADTIEVSSKDTEGGWKANLAGMKEWSIDTEGVYVGSDTSHAILSAAFTNATPVCIKIYDAKQRKGLFGGLAVITDYPLEAPFDDAVTYSLTLSGMGPLTDLTDEEIENEKLPA